MTPLDCVGQLKAALLKERWESVMKCGIYIVFHSPFYRLQCTHPHGGYVVCTGYARICPSMKIVIYYIFDTD
jgi:hypothetical protein